MRAREFAAAGRDAVPHPGVVDRTERATFGARAVVGDEHDERVVEVAELVDEREDATDLRVGVRRGSRRSTP